eukprot:763040-Hanusia_phi.AAC.1
MERRREGEGGERGEDGTRSDLIISSGRMPDSMRSHTKSSSNRRERREEAGGRQEDVQNKTPVPVVPVPSTREPVEYQERKRTERGKREKILAEKVAILERRILLRQRWLGRTPLLESGAAGYELELDESLKLKFFKEKLLGSQQEIEWLRFELEQEQELRRLGERQLEILLESDGGRQRRLAEEGEVAKRQEMDQRRAERQLREEAMETANSNVRLREEAEEAARRWSISKQRLAVELARRKQLQRLLFEHLIPNKPMAFEELLALDVEIWRREQEEAVAAREVELERGLRIEQMKRMQEARRWQNRVLSLEEELARALKELQEETTRREEAEGVLKSWQGGDDKGLTQKLAEMSENFRRTKEHSRWQQEEVARMQDAMLKMEEERDKRIVELEERRTEIEVELRAIRRREEEIATREEEINLTEKNLLMHFALLEEEMRRREGERGEGEECSLCGDAVRQRGGGADGRVSRKTRRRETGGGD